MAWRGVARVARVARGALPLAVLLLVLAARPSSARGVSPRERGALARAGFLRDSVESVPGHEVPGDGERGAHRSSLRSPAAAFGTRALPLRAAVERPPSPRDRAHDRFPLRDAVEHRPAPDSSVAPPTKRVAVSRPARPSPRTPQPMAQPGASWWRSAVLPSLTYVVPVVPVVPGGPQVWPGALRSSQYASPLLQAVQPQQRWGIVAQPNFVFSNIAHRQQQQQAAPVLAYQAVAGPEPDRKDRKVVCYLEAWAAYRRDVVAYSAQNVDPFACTHLLYAFASIDPHSFRVVPQDEEYDLVKGGYRSAVGLKRKNPNLKVMLSVGGWMEGSTKFSQMASRAERRREFIRSVVTTLNAHKFDGLDLDWEYPGALDLGGMPSDKDHFSLLVDELSEVFRAQGWLLSAAVSPSRFRMEDAYDVARVAASLDFVNLMAFDLHAERDSAADHHAPLSQRPHDASIDIFYNVDYAVKYWIRRGAPADKLILGVPFYGRSFTLKDPARYTPGSPIKGLGKEGKYTQEKGFLAYFEICELQSEGSWRLAVDRAGSPFMVKGDQWVGYEDAVSVAKKMAYIRQQNLGGVMLWAVDLDDFQGACGAKTPLLNAVRSNIDGSQPAHAPGSTAEANPPGPAPLVTGKPSTPSPDNDPSPPSPPGPVEPSEAEYPTPAPPPSQAPPASPGLAVSVDRNATNCTGTGFAADAVDCNVYHRCDWGSKTTYVCPEPLHFHLGPNQCDWPHLAGCSKDGPKAIAEVDAEAARACAQRDGALADPHDCRRYYLCAGGRAHRLRCAAGQHFHAASGLCSDGDPQLVCQDNKHVDAPSKTPQQDPQQPGTKRYQLAQRKDFSNRDLIGEDNYKVACYFTSWSSYRKKEAKFVPEHLDPRLCTHIVYAFASLDPETLALAPFDTWADIENNFYDRVTALPDPRKGRADQVKVMLAMGGWTDSTGSKYSDLVNNATSRATFVSEAVSFLRRHNFRGLQIDWNYPKCWHSDCRKGPASDKPNFTALIKELHAAFSKQTPPLALAVGVSGYKEIVDNAYELAALSEHVEYLAVMTYDYHGPWEGVLGHVSPLYYRDGDRNPYYSTNATLEYLVSRGADRGKLLPGVPFYGQSFTLKSKDRTGMGDPADGPGEPGEFTLQPGMLAYYEICDRIRRRSWNVGKDSKGATGPYAYSDTQWVSFDDVASVKAKARFIKNMGFGGAVAWTVDLDDFGNRCCREPFPLLRAINRVLGRLVEDEPQDGDCTRPPSPVTPVAPMLTTGVDTGEGGGVAVSSTTWPSWSEGGNSPTTPSTTTWSWQPDTTSTTLSTPPWWEPSTSTTAQPTAPTTAPTTTTTETPPALTIASPNPTEATTATPGATGESCQSGDYLPDPSNCNAYYRCILGELKQQFCAAGLHWNKDAKVCDWPSEGGCGSQTEAAGSADGDSTTSTSTSTTTPSSTTAHEWWTQAPTTERPDQWWTPVTQSTTSSTTSWPSWQPDTTSSTSSTTTEAEPSASASSTEDPASTSTAAAAPDCDSGQYYPSPSTCEKFFICVNGQRVEQHCASGLVWNQDKAMCDWSFNVKCGGGGQRDEELRGGEPECAVGEYRSDPDCRKYFVCVHGELVAFTCAPGLQWNKDKNVCDWPVSSQCVDSAQGGGGEEPSESVDGKPSSGEGKPDEGPAKPDEGPAKPDEGSNSSSGTDEGGSESVSSETDGSEWATWKPTTTTKNPWAWEPTIVTPPPVVDNEPLGPLSGHYKIVCYFTNWAWYRQGQGKYLPEDVNPNLCTHIVYGFAVLDYENLVIKAHDSWADFDNKFYERVINLKKKGKKVTLALGGWNDSAGDKYSRLVNNPAARRRFIKHALDFLDRYGFDGLDLDWEYPKCWQVNCDKGPDSDKAAFGAFVRELRVAFNVRKLLLSAAVSPSKTVIDAGYDVPALAASLDWVAVMTYDYHGQWDKKTGHVAPMYFHPDDDFYFFNANYSINYWIQEGVPRRKIVMGMPLYGQSFQLAEASTNGLNARAPGPGSAGEFTRAAGFLAYYEICDRVKNDGWTIVQDPKKRMGPYAFHGNQWVSYDDVDMIKLKSQYIRDMDLGGGMIWALDLDDFRNVCGQGRHPLLKTIRRVLGPAPGGSGEAVTEKPEPVPNPEKPEPVPNPEKPEPVPNPEPPAKPDTAEKPEATAGKPETSPVVAEVEEAGQHAPGKPGEGGPATPDKEEELVENSEFKVVCYFTNWAWYRQDLGRYLPSNIDPDLCTHIVYGFAVLDGDELTIKPHDSWADLDNKFYEKVTALKKKGIKVTVAIGGWNDSAGDKYSRLVSSTSARERFVKTLVEFIEEYNFDGLDLDWEYPKCWQVNCKLGPDSDKQGFADLVSELRAAFQPKGWLLSAAVSPNKAVMDVGYDVPALSRDLDWIAVMAYDYHGQWDKRTGHVAPMFVHPSDADATFNTNFTINYWISQGADRRKLVLGMPLYGQSFSLADASNHGLNAPTYGGGEAGDFTRARGFLSYYEICYLIQRKGYTVVRDPTGAMGPYAYKGDQWVSFDDIAMIRYKSEWARDMGLGGGMVWALDLDDFTDRCHCEAYPLLRTINRVLRGYRKPDPKCTLATSKDADKDPKEESNAVDSSVDSAAGFGGSESVSVDSAGTSAGKECSAESAFLPHESDCNKYYTCQFGQLLLQACPENLYWSGDHCDWPENSKCKASSGPDSIPTTTAKPTTEASTAATTPMTPVDRPKPPAVDAVKPPESEYKVVCYFTNWAWYRQGIGKYTPDDIDADLCTHITYGFAVLDGSTLTIKPHDSWADLDNDFYQKVVALKKKGIKVLIAIGGWNDSLGDKYSRLANDATARRRFIENLIQFIEKYDFDGLDLDWEYPKCWQVNCNLGPESDKEGFAALVRELGAEFKPRGWLLSSAVSPSKLVIDEGYDVPTLSEHLDWIAVMTYDYHGHWDKQTGHVAPLYYVPGDTFDYFNANFTIHYWMEKGADRRKLVLGMPMYGQSFALADADERGLNAQAYGPGEAGEFTRAGGFLSYYEICDNVKNKDWKVVRDPEGRVGPYAYRGNQWVSYDDVDDIRRKSKFVKELGLGGGMIWALDLDDFRNRCGCGEHPLLKTINQELRGLPYSTVSCT